MLTQPIQPTFSADVKDGVANYYRMATPGPAECEAFDAWNSAWRAYNQAFSLWMRQQISIAVAEMKVARHG